MKVITLDVSSIVDLTSDMFTLLSRLLALVVSEWTNFPVRIPAAVVPAGIHPDRLTKIFTNCGHPCAFTLPAAGNKGPVITGDIIMTPAFLPDSQVRTSHICARSGSAHLKEYGSVLLPEYVPDLFKDIGILATDVGRDYGISGCTVYRP
ncbi:MAG TPA: hypothetical protein VFE04_11090 [Puia sp.]|jgi:hypothetical protein|nr:hypothetical protein [Puia sp.]